MVYVLKNPLDGLYNPRYHTSKMCPMVRWYEEDYVPVPKWLAEQAGLERCMRNGACKRTDPNTGAAYVNVSTQQNEAA